ncbi:MAG TPA: HEAT repeat domain-containing protein, partial [Gemmatimonadales bacterium]|nr:HEAT repeat domain-containing protein [Gemmatimonadales bacterium]
LLLRGLADRDPLLQAEALDLLVARDGPRILPTLLALLGAADSLRYHVIRALGRLASPEAVMPLQRLFPSAPLHEQLEILTALGRIGCGHSRDFFLTCLDHGHGEIRRAAAQGLAGIAGAEDLDLLNRLARSPDWVMRTEAARAFGRLGLPASQPVLLDLARDLEPVVARTARAALTGPP